MSKKVRTIIISVIVLIVLIGLLVFLKLNPPKPEEGETSSITSSAFTEVTLIEEDGENFVSLKIKNAKDEYTILSQGENLWGITDIMDFPQDTTLYYSLMGSVYSVKSSEIVMENCTTLDQFGLKDPELMFEATFKGDKVYKISVGNLSSDGSTRYVCVTGEDTVYGFSATAFASLYKSRYDFIVKEIIPGFDAENPEAMPKMDYFSVSRPDLKEPIILEKVNTEGLSENAIAPYSMNMTSPVNALINETPTQKFILGNFGLTAQEIVKAKPTPADLTEYGLDKPTSVFTMKYNSTSSVKITTGKGIECTHDEKEDLKDHTHKIVSYYAMREGTDLVYVLDVTTMAWFDIKPNSLLSAIAVLPHVLDIDTIDVTVGGKTSQLDFIDGKDPKDASLLTSSFGGKLVTIEFAKNYLQLLYMTVIQDINVDKTTDKKADATIKYNYKNGKSDVIEYFILDDLSCILSVNGNKAFTTRSAMVDKLAKETENLLQNKEIDADW